MSQTGPSRTFLVESRARLQRQRQTLKERIASETGTPDRDERAALAAEAHDRGEESLVNALAGVHYASVAHDREEARDVEAALARIADDSYGFCVDCGQVIPEPRLVAYPTAKRCRACQERYERGVLRGRAAS